MGILNIHNDFVIFNIQNYVFWIFIVTSRMFKIPRSLWIFKIPMTPAFNIPVTALSEYSKYPWRHFMNFQNTHECSNCTWRHFMHTQNTHNVTSEYSKNPWRLLELNYRWPHLMNTQITHEVTSWVFKRPITSLHEFSKYPWLQHSNIQITDEAFWIFIGFEYSVMSWEYSKADVMGILEYSKEV